MVDYPSHRHQRSARFRQVQRDLGARVRALRQAKGLTLEEAGELAEMDFRHLQRIETAKMNVTLATLDRVAMSLGVTVGELFERDANTTDEGTEAAASR